MSRLASVARRIERDFAEPRLRFPGVEFRAAADWPEARPPRDLSTISPPEVEDDYVCISGGHWFRVDRGLDDEELVVEVVDQLRDDAMDELNAPWPSLVVPSGVTAVLEPRLSDEGLAVWSTKAGYRCPVGQLQHVFGALKMIV